MAEGYELFVLLGDRWRRVATVGTFRRARWLRAALNRLSLTVGIRAVSR